MAWFDCGLTFSHFYLVTSNLLPNFLIAVTHSVFNIMSSVIALNQIDGSELWKKVGFKHSEKVLVALRGVYNLPFNLDDPVLNTSSGLHATPAGQYPERGPKPSKFGVLFYLLSIMFCCIGIIIICRFPFIEVGH